MSSNPKMVRETPQDECFEVTWTIHIYAQSAKEAAEHALKIQRNPESTATVFDVVDSDGNEETIDFETFE